MKFALTLAILLASFAVGFSLKCYSCTNCKDNGDEKTCESGMDQCLKTYAKKGDEESTIRSCTNKLLCEAAKTACEKADSSDTCEAACCDSDLCNAGAAPTFSVLVISLCSVLTGIVVLK